MAKSKTRLKKPIVANPSYTVTQLDNRGQATYPSTPTVKRKLQLPTVKELPQGITVSNTAQAIDVARNKKRYPNESLQTNTLRNQASKVQSQATSSMMAGLDPTNVSGVVDALAYGIQAQDALKSFKPTIAARGLKAFGKILPVAGRVIDVEQGLEGFRQADSMYSKAAEIDSTQKSLRDKMEQKFGNGGYTGRATTADSLEAMNASIAVQNYYDNLQKKGWYAKPTVSRDPSLIAKKTSKKELDWVEEMSLETYKRHFNYPSTYRKDNTRDLYPKVTNEDIKKKAKQSILDIKNKKPNTYVYKDLLPQEIDEWAPPTVINTKIKPNTYTKYETPDKIINSGKMAPGGYRTEIVGYDPIVVKPAYLKTDADYEYVKKNYPKLYKNSPKPSTPRTLPLNGDEPPVDNGRILYYNYGTPEKKVIENPENYTTPFKRYNANDYIMGKYKNGGPINKKVVIPPTPYTVTAVDANSVRQAAPRLTPPPPPPSPMRVSTKPQVKRRDSLIDAQIKYVQANKSKNDTLNYAVIDKNSNNIVYVDRNGKRIKNEPIITGVDSGDVTTAPSQQEYYKSNLKDKYKDYYDYLDQIKQKITPAGVFSTKLITNYTEPIGLKNKIKKIIDKDAWQEAKNHRIESYGPTGQLLTLTDEEGKESSKAIHGTGYMNRIAALKDTTNKTSRNMSNGCINLDGTSCGFSTLKDNSKVYILPERDTLAPYTKPVKLEYGGKVTSLKNTNINDYTMGKYKNGGKLCKCEDGGALDPSDAAISKVLAFRNQSREAMQRAMDPNQPSLQSNTMGEPRLKNVPNSQRSTHYMAYDLDKTGSNPVVYPTINMTPSGLKYNGFEGARNAGNVMPMPSNRVADMFSNNGYKVATGMNKRELGGYVRNLGIINDERNWLTPKTPPVSNKKSMGVDVYGVSGNTKFSTGGDTEGEEGEEGEDFRDVIAGFAQKGNGENGNGTTNQGNLNKTVDGISEGLGLAATGLNTLNPLSDPGQYGKYDVRDRGKMAGTSALSGTSMGLKIGANPALVAATGGLSIVAGAALGAITGGVAGTIMAKKRERDKAKQVAKDQAAYQDRAASTLNFNNNVGVDNTAMYADGGLMKRPLAAAMMNRQNSNMKPMSENATEVKGRSHAEGGEALPDLGAEVEAGETTEGSYVFSKKLGFADLHRPLARAMGKIEKKPMTPDRVNALRLLQGKVEMLKAQQEQVRKQLNLA